MKSMKYFFGALSFVASTFMATSCTDYNLIDTGVANGDHQTTMWEYFKTDPYNWDSLRVMAERADLFRCSKAPVLMAKTSPSLV